MAKYMLTEKAFIEPYILDAGSIIETNSEPSLKWVPMDAEAQAKMQKLYDKEYTRINPLSGKTESYQPHVNKRDIHVEGKLPPEKVVSTVLSTPGRPDIATTIGLAEAANGRGVMMEDAIHRPLPGSVIPRPGAMDVPPASGSVADQAQPGDEAVGGTTILTPVAAKPPEPGKIGLV